MRSPCSSLKHKFVNMLQYILVLRQNEQAMKIHMDSLQESINEMQSEKWKLVSELDRLNKKKKKVEEEPLRELKTARVRSSSSNILVRERSRLKSR